MHHTTTLAYVKGLLKSIHQPLPLSKKESDRLLNVLTSSFRKHLDAEHGPVADQPRASSPAAQHQHHHRPRTAETPINRHLRSILSNPLLSRNEQPKPIAMLNKGAESLFLGERDPMDVFDEAVAKDMMTLQRAAGCLMAKRAELFASPVSSAHSAMAKSGAGHKVVEWLRASGQEHMLFFVNPAAGALRRELLYFLSFERLESIVWSWFESLISQTTGAAAAANDSSNGNPLAAHHLLFEFARSKAAGNGTLDQAYDCLKVGWDLAVSASASQGEHNDIAARHVIGAWRHICWESTVDAWQHPRRPSTARFEAFSTIADDFTNHRKNKLQLSRAHLALHHPTKPDPSPALDLLHHEAIWKWVPDTPSAKGKYPIESQIRSMTLDTVKHLTKHGDSKEAESLLELLKKHFPIPFSPAKPAHSHWLAGV